MFNADGQTDVETYMTKLTDALRNFMNAPKNDMGPCSSSRLWTMDYSATANRTLGSWHSMQTTATFLPQFFLPLLSSS